jgi:Helix-turn-helix domain
MLHFALPRHLRLRREKVFGPAPEHRLDGNAKARLWATASAYNAANRRLGQHQGPLTWATLRVLRALLWRFHGADGGGRCFPAYEKIAAAAKCARSSVAVAIKALEEAGILTWVNRIARIRLRERDLFGHLVTVWQMIRTSNGYRFVDPLDREPGRKGYKSENPTRPQNRDIKKHGARPDGTQVIQVEPPQTPPVLPGPPAIAPQGEQASEGGAKLSPTERAAIVARMNAGTATKADWAAWAGSI